jgi:hypothetical protein
MALSPPYRFSQGGDPPWPSITKNHGELGVEITPVPQPQASPLKWCGGSISITSASTHPVLDNRCVFMR